MASQVSTAVTALRAARGLRTVRGLAIPLAILAALLLLTAVVSPDFFKPQNILNVARQASIVGVIAVGMTFVILTGGIDLSVGSILALAAVATAMLIDAGYSLELVLPAVIVLGALAGSLNGLGVAWLGIQPFVMTLAMMVLLRGVALRVADGGPQQFFADSPILDVLGSGDVGPFPGPLLIFAALALLGWAALRYLPFGRFIYAVGGSLEAARLSGVPTKRVLIGAYAVSGACAAVAGLMTVARLGVGDPIAGSLVELDAIAAVVIGGTSLMGGVGGMTGTVAGAFLLAVLANVLNLAGVSPFDQQIVKGLVIIAAVLIAARAVQRRVTGSNQTGPGTTEGAEESVSGPLEGESADGAGRDRPVTSAPVN